MRRDFKVFVVPILVGIAVMGLVVMVAFGQASRASYLPVVSKQNTPTPTITPTPTPTATLPSFSHRIVFDVSSCTAATLTGEETGTGSIRYTINSNDPLANTVILAFGLWQDGSYYGYSSSQRLPSSAEPANPTTDTAIAFRWFNKVGNYYQYFYFKLGGGPVNSCPH